MQWIKRKRTQGVLLLWCILWCFAMAVPVCAEEASKTVRVAVIDYPNYLAMDEEGNVSGYAYDYLQEVTKYTNWKLEYVRMTFSEAMDALEAGEIDILAGNQYVEERTEKIDYSARSMGEGGSVLCVRADDVRYCYNDYGSYGGMKIAALKGSIRIDQAKSILAKYGVFDRFIEYDTDEEAKTALENEEVDAVLMSSIRCEGKYKILARLDSTALYFCTNKSDPELKSDLDAAMQTIHLNDPYYEQRLDEKHYGSISIQLAFTQDEKHFIENAGVITVAVSDEFAPNEYYNEKDHAYHGITPDIMDLIAKNSGLTFTYVSKEDADHTLAMIDSGEIDLIASVADNTQVSEKWHVTLTDAYRNNSMSIVIRNGDNDYKDMDCEVVLKSGYPYIEQEALDEGYHNFIYADTFSGCLKQVHEKKADMTFIPSNSTDIMIGEQAYDDLSAYLLPNSNMDFCIGVSQMDDPLLVSILNKSIAAITDEERNVLLIENLNIMNDTMSFQKFVKRHKVTFLLIGLGLAVLVSLGVFALAEIRKRTNHKLAVALEQADAANYAKTDFLSRMSHDIRTPMNAIIGLTHLAKEEKSQDTVRQYLDNIDVSSNFLLGLINDVLDMSKIESGALTLSPEPYEKTEFQQAINTVIGPLMKEKHITFTFEMTDIIGCILVDKLRFNQIFFNLLSNAAKFTPVGGHVDFIVTSLPVKDGLYGARYCIKDNGCGMSREFLPHIFETFSQERTKDNESEKGTGLGLPIVKSLTTAMGGTVAVESELGKGTQFTVEIYTPAAEKETAKKEKRETYDILKKAKILLVEDNDMNILVAQKLLEKAGCIIDVAKNGQQGVDLFNASKEGYYSAVLMDVRMPIMDGITAAKTIRSLDRKDAKTVPIIAMTADAFEEEKKKTAEAGMNYHLSKPINPQEMYDVLIEQIER